MKKYLTKEQSKELIESGIHSDKASFIVWKPTRDFSNNRIDIKVNEHLVLKPFRPAIMGFEQFDCHDVFSLSDLMEILPTDIDGNDILIKHVKNGWSVCYVNCEGSTHIQSELIDALYHILLWYCETFKIK